MLALPEQGMRKSVLKHNCRWTALFDWIEASVLLTQERVSKMEVVDHLCDQSIYIAQESSEYLDDETSESGITKQAFAYEALDVVWEQIEVRQSWLGDGATCRVVDDVIEPLVDWVKSPGFSFCMVLALTELYPTWEGGFLTRGHVEQGDLFEKLSMEALLKHGWEVKLIGWSPIRSLQFKDVVGAVADFVNEPYPVEAMIDLHAERNDAGLDLVCCQRFGDDRAAIPSFFVQCASGKNWKDKTHTPDIDLWADLITFASRPKKALAMPFSFEDGEAFFKSAKEVRGILFDRYRLLGVNCRETQWLTVQLRDELVAWLRPRIAGLLKYDGA